MTAMKNVTFSRVRTTFAECHVWVIAMRRWETYRNRAVNEMGQTWPASGARSYLQLVPLQVALELDVGRGHKLVEVRILENILLQVIERGLRLGLEAVAGLCELTLQQVEMGVEIGFHGVCDDASCARGERAKRIHAPRSVNPLAQSEISSRTNRSKGTENTPDPLFTLLIVGGGDGGREGGGIAMAAVVRWSWTRERRGKQRQDSSSRLGKEDACATRLVATGVSAVLSGITLHPTRPNEEIPLTSAGSTT